MERASEIIPFVCLCDALDLPRSRLDLRIYRSIEIRSLCLEYSLKTLGQCAEIYALGVSGPHRTSRVVFESLCHIGDAPRSWRVFLPVEICNHKSLLVSLVSVALHADPSQLRTVRAPYRVGVVTALHIYHFAFTGLYIIYIDLGVGRKGIFLTHQLAA